MTPTQPAPLDDAGAMAVLEAAADDARCSCGAPECTSNRQCNDILAARAHLAARVAELEEAREVLFGGLDRDRDNITTRNLAVVAVNALAIERDRATRAEAELANANFAVTELREELASLRTYAAANADRASRAEAELAAGRASAERYVWLRSRVSWQRPGDEKPWTTPSGVYLVATMVSAVYGNCDEQTDAAIDAARGAG